ncbi:MAG TPA: hypothetical protein VKG91_01905 [Roseiarcus sp.]|nr:hypothetical protein [Roseiarcus sp.]
MSLDIDMTRKSQSDVRDWGGEFARPGCICRKRDKAIGELVDALEPMAVDTLGRQNRLDELLSDPRQTLEALASREGKTERSIRMTVSLAFLAPDIVKAAVEGRLPRGYGLKRLIDLPLAWPDQWRTLGLEAPARACPRRSASPARRSK